MRSASGASRTNLRSIARNKAVGVSGGAILMAVGVWGMIMIGDDTLSAIETGEYTSETSKQFQMNSYVFVFAIVGGLMIFLYAAIPIGKKPPDPAWRMRS